MRGFIFEQAVRTHSTEVDAFAFRIIFVEDAKGFSLIRLVLLQIVPCLGSLVEVYNVSEVMMRFVDSV